MKRTELRRTGPPARRTPLRRGKPMRSRRRDDIPAPVRAAVRARSGGVCERCGVRPAAHQHHRLRRSQGGAHTAENLADLCAPFGCHVWVHHNVDAAVADGWLIRAGVAA